MANIVSTGSVGGYYVESVETFTFDDGTVVYVTQDTDSENPCDWYSDTILCVYRAGYRSVNNDGKCDVLINTFLAYRDRGEDDDRALMLAKRYARTFYGDTRPAILGNMIGYSQSDWADFIVVGEDAAMLATSWGYWARGDVYCAYTDDDSLGGIFADSAEEAAMLFHADMIGD